MTDVTLRGEQEAAAVARILDGAGAAFTELGVRSASMEEVARRAGCSRATLYKYFANRHALRVAFVNRAALELAATIGEAVAPVADPADRLVAGIVTAVREVRARPTLAVWFTEPDLGVTAEVTRDSEVLDAIAGGFLAGMADDPVDSDALRQRARWVVRVIVSLLAVPGTDAADEETMVREFVVPALVAG